MPLGAFPNTFEHSDAGEAQTHGPSVSSQALYHWATVLPVSFSFSVYWKTINRYFGNQLGSALYM